MLWAVEGVPRPLEWVLSAYSGQKLWTISMRAVGMRTFGVLELNNSSTAIKPVNTVRSVEGGNSSAAGCSTARHAVETGPAAAR